MTHLKSNHYKTVIIHVIFWIAFMVYTGIDAGHHHRDHWSFFLQAEDFCDMLIAMVVVYINLYILMPLFYAEEKYFWYFITLLLALVVGGMISRFFSWQVWLPRERITEPENDEPTNFWVWGRIVGNSFTNFPVLALTVLIKMMFDANIREKKMREIEKEKFTAEMSLLKAQINPHFLFNTLNSLYALALARSEKSAAVVLRLSNLMRYMLYEASANTVRLKDEIAYLENYLGIEQMRFADRLDLSFQYSGDIGGKSISPLLLLPFIENAFKHGIEDSSGWITIDLKVDAKCLYLKVENSFPSLVKTKMPGLGLTNVKRRLELAYPDRHELKIMPYDDIYSVELTLQF